MTGKYGSLQLDEDERKDANDKNVVDAPDIKKDDGGSRPGHAYFEALKEDSQRDYEALDEESSVVLDDIPLPLKLAPLLKRLTDSDELSEEDILSIIFIIRIAEAMHRYVRMCV
jgi:hypothetical protein